MLEIEIEHLKTNENVVIMRLKDYKNLKQSTNSYYKCWREDEKRIKKAIEYIEEHTYNKRTKRYSYQLVNRETKVLLDILKGSDKE